MLRNNKKNRKKTTAQTRPRQLTELERQIKDFCEQKLYNSTPDNFWHSASLFQKEILDNKLHAVFSSMVYAMTAAALAIESNTKQTCRFLDLTIGIADTIDSGSYEWHLYCNIVLPHVNDAIVAIIDQNTECLLDPIINDCLTVMKSKYENDPERITQVLTSATQTDRNTLFQFIIDMHAQSNHWLSLLSKCAKLFPEHIIKISEANLYYSLQRILLMYILLTHANTMQTFPDLYPENLTEILTPFTKGISLHNLTINAYCDGLNIILSRVFESKLTNTRSLIMSTVTQLLIIKRQDPKKLLPLLDLIAIQSNKWLKLTKFDIRTHHEILPFQFMKYIYNDLSEARMEDFTTIQESLLKIINCEEYLRASPRVHLYYIWSNLIGACVKYHHDYAKQINFNQRKTRDKNVQKLTLSEIASVHSKKPIGSRSIHRGLMDHATILLKKNKYSIRILSGDHISQYLSAVIPPSTDYLCMVVKLLPTVSMLKLENTNQDAQEQSRWKVDLNWLKNLYDELANTMRFLTNHSEIFMDQSIQFQALKKLEIEWIIPQMKAIKEEIASDEVKVDQRTQPLALEIETSVNQIQAIVSSRHPARFKKMRPKQPEYSVQFFEKRDESDEDQENSNEIATSDTQKNPVIAAFEECDQKLLIKTNSLYGRLSACTHVLNRIAKSLCYVTPKEAGDCYQDLENIQGEYRNLASDYSKLLNEMRHYLDNQECNKNEMIANIDIITKCQNDLKSTIDHCYHIINAIKKEIQLSHFHNIMSLGFVKNNMHDSAKQEALLVIGKALYIDKIKVSQTCQSQQIIQCQNIYLSGVAALDEYIEDYRLYRTTNRVSNHKQIFDQFYSGAEQKDDALKFNDNHPDLIYCRLNIKSDSFFTIFETLSNDSPRVIEAVQTWVFSIIATKKMTHDHHVFSPSLLNQFMTSWFMQSDVMNLFAMIKKLTVLAIMLPLNKIQLETFKNNASVIYKQLMNFTDALQKLPQEKRNHDRLLSHMLSIILLATFPINTLIQNLVAWHNNSLPIYQFVSAFELSENAESMLYAFISGALAKHIKLNPIYPHEKINIMRNIVIKQVNTILDHFDLVTIPYYLIIYGSASIKHVLQMNHQPTDIDIMTNIDPDDLTFKIKPHPHLHALGMYLVEDMLSAHLSGISLKIDASPLFNQLKQLDFTIHLIIFDLPTQQSIYLSSQAIIDLQQQILRCLVSHERLMQEPKRLLRYVIAGGNYLFSVASSDQTALLFYLWKKHEPSQNSQRKISEPICDPDQLLNFISSKLTRGSISHRLSIAWNIGLLPQLFPIPVSALPISEESFGHIKKRLIMIDQTIKEYSSANELLADIITSITIALRSTQQLTVVISDVINAIIPFYSDKAESLKNMVEEKLHVYLTSERSKERITTIPATVFNNGQSNQGTDSITQTINMVGGERPSLEKQLPTSMN